MNAMFLKDLADKTRRGLRGRIEQGRSGGGITYGYDAVKKFDANGEPDCGERKINDEQARIVKRIFREYATGKSPIAIAKDLNKEGVKGPAGRGWNHSTINGNRQRGTGIPNNELYIGRMVWNRLRYIKNPDTGKRVSRLNPEDQWVIKEIPELRMIEAELWDHVKERQARLSKKMNYQSKQRPKLLFSGLIKCSCCGGGFTKISKTHYGCHNARKKDMCDNFETIRQDKLEQTILGVLQTNLMDPEICEVFCKEYAEYMNQLRMEHNAQRRSYEKELAKRIKDDDRMVQMVIDGIASTASMKDRINENAYRIEELKEILKEEEEAPVLLHPNMALYYQKEVKALIKSLNNEEHRHEAADLIRGLIDKIILTPKEDDSGLYVDLKGDLAGILNMATGNKSPAEKRQVIEQMESISKELKITEDSSCNTLNNNGKVHVQDKLVAGVGFEPTTFRL